MVSIEAATAIWQTLMTATTAFVVLLLALFVYLATILPRLSAEEVSLPKEEPKDLAHALARELVEGLARAIIEALEWTFLTLTLLLVLVSYLVGVVLGLLGVALGDSDIVRSGVIFLLFALVTAVLFLGTGVYNVAKAVSRTRGKLREKGT